MRRRKKQLYMSTSPHLRTKETVSDIMWHVSVALIPALIAGTFFFGMRVLFLAAVAIISAVLSEAVMQRLFYRPRSLYDGSAVLTGLLLALNLPVDIPWWIPAVGSAFAIIIVKQIFGGLGRNIFNPALAGRAFLTAAYPTYMTARWIQTRLYPYLSPFSLSIEEQSAPADVTVESLTGATPLSALKNLKELGWDQPALLEEIAPFFQDLLSWESLGRLFLGNHGGCIGETSILALLLGGAYLFIKKIITPAIPLTYVGTVFLLVFFYSLLSETDYVLQLSLFHILSGGLMLGALFMATDMVTTPVTLKGRVLFGLGCGLLTFTIRFIGGYPEGVTYSILIMNGFTPLIDRYILPVPFGKKVL